MKKNKFIKIKILFIIIFLLFIFSIIFSLININNNIILNGISVNKINISKMSKDDANSKLLDIISKKENNDINISLTDDIETTISFESLDINYNISSCINEAYNIGRIGNIFEDNFTILNLMLYKKNIDVQIDINEEKLNTLLDDLLSNLPDKVIRK